MDYEDAPEIGIQHPVVPKDLIARDDIPFMTSHIPGEGSNSGSARKLRCVGLIQDPSLVKLLNIRAEGNEGHALTLSGVPKAVNVTRSRISDQYRGTCHPRGAIRPRCFIGMDPPEQAVCRRDE